MAFDAEAAEQWYQARQTRRQTDPKNSMARLRNTQRSFWEKEYAGGPLRGAVSDRRSEWMGGGAGGRMGEDWRNHQMIDVERHGSGLDPYTHAAVKGVKRMGKGATDATVGRARKAHAAKRVLKDQTAKAESAELINGMRDWRNQSTAGSTELFPNDTGEVGEEVTRWEAAWPARKARMEEATGPEGALRGTVTPSSPTGTEPRG